MSLGNGDLRRIFEEAFCQVGKRRSPPAVEIDYYPFAGLNNYIRVRNGRATVKLSDILRNAPRSVHRALAYILVAKLLRREPGERFEAVYRAYISTPGVTRSLKRIQRQRGRKRVVGPQGRVRDLRKTFRKLNSVYFGGDLVIPQLSWSAHKTYRILGHLDRVHNTLVISRTLDDARIPEFFYEYILYHEMLHLKHPPRRIGHRYYNHTTEFQADEQRFKYFREAQAWLQRIGSRS